MLCSSVTWANGGKIERHIKVDAQAQIDVAPNIAYLQMTIYARKATPKGAAAAVKGTKARLIAAFRKAGFPSKRLTMSFMRLHPRYKKYNSPEVKYYEASVTLVACIHKLTKLSDYFQLAVENGASRLSTRYVNDKFVQVRKKLRGMAIKAAIAKAKQMTKAAGVALGKVRTIEETRGGYWTARRFSNAYASASRSVSSVQPGAIPMTLTVRVTFYLGK
jgi:uncharacterized protein YggE